MLSERLVYSYGFNLSSLAHYVEFDWKSIFLFNLVDSTSETYRKYVRKTSTFCKFNSLGENGLCEPGPRYEYDTWNEAEKYCSTEEQCSMIQDTDCKGKTFHLCCGDAAESLISGSDEAEEAALNGKKPCVYEKSDKGN